MTCAEHSRLLNAYVDGELDLTLSLEVEAHLESCARCRRALSAMQALRSAIGRSAEMEAAPRALRARASAGIEHERGRSGRTWLRAPLAAAAPGVAALLLAGWLAIMELADRAAPQAAAPMRVVYHISSSDSASAALRNLGNHLRAAPGAKIVVVAHNNGVDFLLRGARDESNQPYASAVKVFSEKGVEFRVCYNTLERRQIASSEVIAEATLVPSGIAEIGRLQSREGYAYMRL